MGRRLSEKPSKRIKLRLDADVMSICNRLSSEELSEVVEISIRSGIRPGKRIGVAVQALMRTENIRTRTIARIATTEEGLIQIDFPERREDFRDVVYPLGYKWNEWCWQRQVSPDVVCDRACEVAHKLLLSGFVVQVDHSGVRDRAITGQYEPEVFRVVKVGISGAYKGWFVFEYPRSEDFYEELKGLTGAKYVDKRIRVPPEHFAEVEDFAEQNDFQLSPKAREALENAKSLWETALLVIPREKQKQKPRKSLTNSNVEVPDALKDYDT